MATYKLLKPVVGPGDLACYAALPFGTDDANRPLVTFLHGAGRHSGVFKEWGDRLAGKADMCLIDLPGHGSSPEILPAGIDQFTQAVGELLRAHFASRRLVLVGDSMGGLVAMKLGSAKFPGLVDGVIAFDPPLTTAKQWAIVNSFRGKLAREPDNKFYFSLANEVFGITPDRVSERIYYPIIGELTVPTILVTGDTVMLPPRKINGVGCLLDAVDEFVIDKLYPGKVMKRRVENSGHLLLSDAPEACVRIIEDMLNQIARTPSEAS